MFPPGGTAATLECPICALVGSPGPRLHSQKDTGVVTLVEVAYVSYDKCTLYNLFAH